MTQEPAPEFSRPVRLDTIGEAARSISMVAEPAECAALARRFGLVAMDKLAGTASILRTAQGIRATGRMTAAVIQKCVATSEDVPAEIDEEFALIFVAAAGGQSEEIELAADDLDIVEYDGQAVDLGEALAQTLALALDPFPRSPNADAALRAAGVLREEEAGPFSALAELKKKLQR